MAGSEDYGYGGLYDRAIRALSGARDWYSERTDPNRPRQRGTGDVNLPVEAPPVEKPWYERIPDVSNIGEQVGRIAGPKLKEAATQTGEVTVGALGSLGESAARMAGTAMDVGAASPYQDVRNTGSESKPVSDIFWEGLKGVKSGYDKPWDEVVGPGDETSKRIPEEYASQVSPFGRKALKFGANLIDVSSFTPKAAVAPLLGLAKAAGAADAAWLPFKAWKAARNVEGLTHKLDAVSDAKEILKKGFDLNRQSKEDVIGRFVHSGYYSPEQAKEARDVGKLPIQKSNTMYTGSQSHQMPVTFEDETKVLDLRAPVPREDLDEITRGMDPVLDKEAIDDLEFAWQDQAKYAEGPGAVTHAQVRSGERTPEQLRAYYKTLENDPIAVDAIERLNELLVRPNKVASGGIYGQGGTWGGGSAPMNQPRMTRKYGIIHHSDYYGDTGFEHQGSVAFDPDQALIAPPETQGTAIEPPWVKAKSYQGKPVPIDVPAGKALPPGGSPVGAVAPTTGPAPKKVNPIEQAQQWAEQNIPVEPPKPKSWDIKPTYKGKPITTYEMGTLNELAARGGPLTKEQQKKLAIIKEYEGGYYAGEVAPPKTAANAVTDHLAQELGHALPDQDYAFKYWGEMEPAERTAFTKEHPDLFAKYIEPKITGKPYAAPVEDEWTTKSVWTPEEQAGKFDVYNQETGEVITTFDTELEALDWLKGDPQAWKLDVGPSKPKGGDPSQVTYPATPIAPSEQATIQKFIDDFDDPYSQDADLMGVWGKLTPDLQAAVKEARPDIANDIKNMSIPGYPMGGGPPVAPAPAKKVLGAKAQGGESMGVKTMQISLKNDEADDILLVWDNLPPKDQIYVKNAMPDEYQKIMDFKAEQQADADFDFAQQGGDEALDVDWETAGKLPAVEAPPAAKTLDDIIYELEHSGFSYDEAVELAPQILKEQGLPSALPEGIQGFGDVPKPKGPVTLSASENMGYLKENYPEVAENFAKHSGTEMGSIEKHTGEVLDQWKTQLTTEDFADISSRYGTDVEALMNVALPLHDIGKPQALASGDKTLQHSFTVPIMSDILKKEGFDQKDIDLATELFNHDMIGSLLQGTSKYTPEQVADQLAKKADKLGMNPSDFAKLQLAFFQADASAYPFVTQFMKQQPNGAWISGSPKVKPIEDLIAGVKSTSTGTVAADTFKLKEANPNLAGMYEKNIYTKGGQDYLFKVADPSKAHMPEMETRANKVAALGGLYDARTAVQTMEGRLGSMQPLIGNKADWPTLRNKDLTKLSSEQLQEIIKHHPVDWLTSNHDAHTGQWLMTSNGIIEIDRGQAWKHFGKDKLSSSYHPNEAFGEEEPIYNQIVELWKDGKLPQLSEGDVKSALGVTTSKLANNKQAVMNNIESALAKFNKSDKIPTAHNRFANLQFDLEQFWKK